MKLIPVIGLAPAPEHSSVRDCALLGDIMRIIAIGKIYYLLI